MPPPRTTNPFKPPGSSTRRAGSGPGTSSSSSSASAARARTRAAAGSADDSFNNLADTPTPPAAASTRPRQRQPRGPAAAGDDTLLDPSGSNELAREPGSTSTPPTATTSTHPAPPSIPTKLLARLIHEHVAEAGRTKIDVAALAAFGRYVDVFVREALARSARVRSAGGAAELGPAFGDDFLQVEDLEKIAPQLLLDF